jgi:hypothetical protein
MKNPRRSSVRREVWDEKRRQRIFMSKDDKEQKKGGILQAVKEFVYGVAAHDSARFALKTRASMEHLFILITMGDMLGVPILPPYYSLRLLPYVVPQISTWKRRMLREKDLTDALA